MSDWSPVKVAILSATGTAVTGPGRLYGYTISMQSALGTIIFADTSVNATPSNPQPAASATLDRQRADVSLATISFLYPSGKSIRFTNNLTITIPTSAEVKAYYS